MPLGMQDKGASHRLFLIKNCKLLKKVVGIFRHECKNIFLDHKRKFLYAGIQEPRWPRASKTLPLHATGEEMVMQVVSLGGADRCSKCVCIRYSPHTYQQCK